MKYLLDTNALIALRGAVHGRDSKDPRRAEQVRRLREKTQSILASDLAMSMISLGELHLWTAKHAQRDKAAELTRRLTEHVRCVGPDAADPSGERIAQYYGEVRAHLETSGAPIGNNDTWIAAHALALNLTVVTNNQGEFSRVPGLQTEDWTQ
ncbi:type II toxin-antitoxin system VapC family toxin [Variovorax sp. JS1663]|uniref:type II toxin-antitoxin system VapC family toxin n=1 Tax=Variovorax sp. JS1663 TaxID=1851577 RepID=UPI000B34390E|nr:type II toxin-antitoxin system VapC family toxin [Variovorax sp. JS1663]OUM03638.1 hypothetical protein A8M77_03710 [Variovorax sp. JS1663]